MAKRLRVTYRKFLIQYSYIGLFEASQRADYENQLFIAKFCFARALRALLRAENTHKKFHI